MTLVIRRFTPDDIPAIGRLNRRLQGAGIAQDLGWEGPSAPPPEGDPSRPVSGRLFVAADEGEIRGGVWLHEQGFQVDGRMIRAGWARLPLAESLIDARYRGVPASLLVHLLREQPRLMALGLGSHDSPFARLLRGLRWTASTVPMQFRIERPARVLRGLRYARRSRVRRLLLDGLAWSGVGWLGHRVHGAITRRGPAPAPADVVGEFGPWADALWADATPRYRFTGDRRAPALYSLFRGVDADLRRVRVRRGDGDRGWVVVVRMDFREREPDPYFGNLVVGLLADGFGPLADVPSLVASGVDVLRDAGVDLILTFQGHRRWQEAFRSHGFATGPSNFHWYRSPAMQRELGDIPADECHVNRGDCDGPQWS